LISSPLHLGISVFQQMNLKIDIKQGLWGQGKTADMPGIFV
jgi:hypothetical protein